MGTVITVPRPCLFRSGKEHPGLQEYLKAKGIELDPHSAPMEKVTLTFWGKGGLPPNSVRIPPHQLKKQEASSSYGTPLDRLHTILLGSLGSSTPLRSSI